jgi:hypothetical protein
MIVCHDVTIKRKLNGWLVQVGCREFVFSLSQEEYFFNLLRLYFHDTEAAIKAAKAYEYDGGIEPNPTAPPEILTQMGRIPEPAGTYEQSRRER